MWNRRRRAAISQSQIRKECRLYGAFAQGHRAFKNGILRDANPCENKEQEAWFFGWDFAEQGINLRKEYDHKNNNNNDL